MDFVFFYFINLSKLTLDILVLWSEVELMSSETHYYIILLNKTLKLEWNKSPVNYTDTKY